MNSPATTEAPLRRRFEAHERRTPARAYRLSRAPDGATDCYADPVTQARWEFWQAAQPAAVAPHRLELTSARAYLDTLKTRAAFSTERTAILRAAQHLMRCVRNSNPEMF